MSTDFQLEVSDEIKPMKQGEDKKNSPKQVDNQSWTLYTNGASSKEISGAGLILRSPNGEEITYALHFDFHTPNHKAEYESFLARLQLEKRMEADRITILTDSILVANQVKGEFESRDK